MSVLDPGGPTGRGACIQDEATWRGYAGGSSVTVELCQIPSGISIEATFEGRFGVTIGGGDDIIYIEPPSGGLPDARDAIRAGVSEARQIESSIERGVSNYLPDEIGDFSRISIQTDEPSIGETTLTTRDNIEFERPEVPQVVEGAFPDTIPISMTARIRNPVQNLIFSSRELSFEMPMDWLVDFEQFGCEALYPDVNTLAQELRDNFNEIQGEIQPMIDTFESARDGMREALGNIRGLSPPTGERQIISEAEDFMSDPLRFVERRAGEAEQDVQNVTSDIDRMVSELEQVVATRDGARDIVRSMRSDIQDFRSDIQDVSEECRGEFLGIFSEDDLEAAEELLDRFERLDEVASISERLVDDVDEIDFDIPEREEDAPAPVDIREELDEIPSRMVSRAESFIAAVDEKRDTPFIDRDRDRFDEILDEGEELLRELQQLEPGRPGRSETIADVRGALGTLDRISVAHTDQIPCSELYPDVEELVQELEEEAQELPRDASPGDLELIESLEEQIAAATDDVSDSCAQEFGRRVRRADRRIDAVLSPVRIAEERLSESAQRRQELIERMLGG